jgi:hypothetical protein
MDKMLKDILSQFTATALRCDDKLILFTNENKNDDIVHKEDIFAQMLILDDSFKLVD